MCRIFGIFCTRRSAEFYWTGGAACSLERVDVKGWMRGGWARGPIAKTGALHGRHLFMVCRVKHFSLRYISLVYISLVLSPKNKRAHSRKKSKPCNQNRSVSIIIFEENNESVSSDSTFARCSIRSSREPEEQSTA